MIVDGTGTSVRLVTSAAGLDQAAAEVATPGSSTYPHFSSLAAAARQFGATDAQINAIAQSVPLPSDLKLAGQCFGYSPPRVDQMQGDGVATTIQNADPETSLDLQTAASVAPKAQFRLVQSTPAGGGILDGFSRA